MLKRTRLTCVIGLLLLTCGCQSYSIPPAPAAWFMEAREPNLPQRLLNELSPSPEAATRD